MPRKPAQRQCRRCGEIYPGEVTQCCACGTTLIKKRFKMTPNLCAQVHILKQRKGLDRELYELNLQAVGVASSKDMNEKQFNEFKWRMRRLPDVPKGASQ